MQISEFAKPVTAKTLNESLGKKFGSKINLEQFTLEQLQDVRNRVRTKLSQVETNESFDTVQNETYQKSKMMLDVLNAAISERGDISDEALEEKKKPDTNKNGIPDYAEDGKGPNDLAKKGKKGSKPKKGKVPPQFQKESVVREGKEDEAELVMAAKEMVDRVTGWMEDTAEMQTESMLELADAIRDEMGSEQSEAFTGSVKPSLDSLYAAMEATREALTAGVSHLTGEGGDMMGADPAMGMDDMGGDDMGDMEPTLDGEEGDMDIDTGEDDFGAAGAAAGGEEPMGREKRESATPKGKRIKEGAAKGAMVKDAEKMSKKAFCKKYGDENASTWETCNETIKRVVKKVTKETINPRKMAQTLSKKK
jgi:hypothetical protein